MRNVCDGFLFGAGIACIALAAALVALQSTQPPHVLVIELDPLTIAQ
jgi:hypothetical protein